MSTVKKEKEKLTSAIHMNQMNMDKTNKAIKMKRDGKLRR